MAKNKRLKYGYVTLIHKRSGVSRRTITDILNNPGKWGGDPDKAKRVADTIEQIENERKALVDRVIASSKPYMK